MSGVVSFFLNDWRFIINITAYQVNKALAAYNEQGNKRINKLLSPGQIKTAKFQEVVSLSQEAIELCYAISLGRT